MAVNMLRKKYTNSYSEQNNSTNVHLSTTCIDLYTFVDNLSFSAFSRRVCLSAFCHVTLMQSVPYRLLACLTVCLSVCTSFRLPFCVQYFCLCLCLPVSNDVVSLLYTVKKVNDFPVPSPGRVWLVTSLLGTGKWQNFFYSVCLLSTSLCKS